MIADEDYIVLKWGTLKGWRLTSEKGQELMREYVEIGASLSVMTQNDTPRQKQLICEMIDEVPGDIYLDWDGRYINKEEAKQYVIGYGQKGHELRPEEV